MRQLTPADIRRLLDAHGIHPSRALGQNFLADPNTARRIVRLAEVSPSDRIVEPGPGIGSLTVALAETGATVVALERDRHVLPVLREVVADAPNVRVEEGDALATDYADLLGPEPGLWSLVGNLPYNVAVPMIAHYLEAVPQVRTLFVMVQREVGERLAAGPADGKAYGAVSVKVAYYGTAAVAGTVPPTVFIPRPKVESALVRIERHAQPPVAVPSPERLFALVQAGFGQRRKTLGRALRGTLGSGVATILGRAGIDPGQRAERLGLEEWAALARAETDA